MRTRDRRQWSACRADHRPSRCGTGAHWGISQNFLPVAASNAITYSVPPRAPSVNNRPLRRRKRRVAVAGPVAFHRASGPPEGHSLQQPGFRRMSVAIRSSPLEPIGTCAWSSATDEKKRAMRRDEVTQLLLSDQNAAHGAASP